MNCAGPSGNARFIRRKDQRQWSCAPPARPSLSRSPRRLRDIAPAISKWNSSRLKRLEQSATDGDQAARGSQSGCRRRRLEAYTGRGDLVTVDPPEEVLAHLADIGTRPAKRGEARHRVADRSARDLDRRPHHLVERLGPWRVDQGHCPLDERFPSRTTSSSCAITSTMALPMPTTSRLAVLAVAGTQLSRQRNIGLIPQRQVFGELSIFPTKHRTKFSALTSTVL